MGDTQVHIALQVRTVWAGGGAGGGGPPRKSHYGVLCNFHLGLASTPPGPFDCSLDPSICIALSAPSVLIVVVDEATKLF